MTATTSHTVIGPDDETPRSDDASNATGEEQDFSTSTHAINDSTGLNLQRCSEDDVSMQKREHNCYMNMRQKN